MEACCCVSHYVRRFSCIVSRPYRDRLPLRYIHFTTYFTTRRSSKYPGLSQPNTQRSGMRRHKTLPHIIHCCHVATLSSSSAKHSVPDILGQLLLVTLCKKVTWKLLTIVRNRRQSRSHWIQWSLSYLVVWWLRRLWWGRQLEQTGSLGELQNVPFKQHIETTALNQCYLTWGGVGGKHAII